MATYVIMLKEYEDSDILVYLFGPDRQSLGKMQFFRTTGEYLQLKPVPNTDSLFYFQRTAAMLMSCYESGLQYPERTHYAS